MSWVNLQTHISCKYNYDLHGLHHISLDSYQPITLNEPYFKKSTRSNDKRQHFAPQWLLRQTYSHVIKAVTGSDPWCNPRHSFLTRQSLVSFLPPQMRYDHWQRPTWHWHTRPSRNPHGPKRSGSERQEWV